MFFDYNVFSFSARLSLSKNYAIFENSVNLLKTWTALGRTAILFTVFFHFLKIYKTFFVQQYIIEDYFPKKGENKKTRAKNYYQVTKEKWSKRSREYYRKLSEDEKIDANIRNENMSDEDRERKKEFMKNCYYKNNVESFN